MNRNDANYVVRCIWFIYFTLAKYYAALFSFVSNEVNEANETKEANEVNEVNEANEANEVKDA